MPKTTPAKTSGVPNTEHRKRRREWLIVLFIIGLVALSLRFQGRLFDLTAKIPLTGNILVLALINLNILLIILCLFLVLRNIFKLLLERRKRIPGARLRSKLALAFIALSLIPTLLLFFVSAGFIANSIENWFNSQVEESLQESLEVAQTYYKNSASNALYYAEQISLAIKDQKLLNEANGLLNVDERRKVFCKLEDIQQTRGSIGIPFWRNAWYIMRKRVKNVTPVPSIYMTFNEAWLA